ncbi:MAG: MurR/RpiR family transcriptional regulator [Nocardioides sp.]|uniref:MurR/RpiR family transcriptional regulator n=1 Tax=Nocardioides sp. TaxID=35761 RepID=UPI0039E6ED8C
MRVDGWIEELAAQAALGTQASRIVQVLAAKPRFSSYASAREIADSAGVNISTVTRTAQNLGFSGWPSLQLELRNRFLASLTASEMLADHADPSADPLTAAFQRDAENLALAMRTIDFGTLRTIAETIAGARRTLVIGSGSYLAPVVALAHVAAIMGLDVHWDPMGGTHRVNLAARLGPGDCLVTFNVWRTPREILEITRFAHERGATTCVITDRIGSPITPVGDHVLVVPSEGVTAFPSLTASMSVVHALLGHIALQDVERSRATALEVEDVWRRLDLMVDQPDPG